jgi:hypothetical protein
MTVEIEFKSIVAGKPGLQGPQGLQGAQGSRGPLGPQGPNGPDGDTLPLGSSNLGHPLHIKIPSITLAYPINSIRKPISFGLYNINAYTLYLVPFIPTTSVFLTQLGVNISTAGNMGSQINVVIYAPASPFVYTPRFKIVEGIPVETSSASFKLIPISCNLSEKHLYWVGVAASANCTVYRYDASTFTVNFAYNTDGSIASNITHAIVTLSSLSITSFPNDLSTQSSFIYNNGYPPAIFTVV